MSFLEIQTCIVQHLVANRRMKRRLVLFDPVMKGDWFREVNIILRCHVEWKWKQEMTWKRRLEVSCEQITPAPTLPF